jgi:hypothetical protein
MHNVAFYSLSELSPAPSRDFAMLKLCVLLVLPLPLFAFELFTLPDGSRCKWDLANLSDGTIHWRIGVGAPETTRDAMLFATQTWSAGSAGVLRFSEAAGGIEVLGVDTLDDASNLAQTSLQLNGAVIEGAQVKINLAKSWVRGTAKTGSFDLDAVLLHELGHALGLGHSDDDAHDIVGGENGSDLPTMNSIITQATRTLHRDDIAAIRELYGIDAPLPEISIEASPAIGKAPLNVAFFQTGGSEEMQWYFGDGTALTGASATHRFKTPGIYTITAFVNGMKATTTVELYRKIRKKRALKKQ